MTSSAAPSAAVATPFEVYDDWQVNTGGDTIHAKRMPGRFRSLKWLSAAIWLPFFFGPYLRWGDRQAVLFDIENGRFHLFGATVHPDDIWMLALVLLFFAMLLALFTVVAGRAWCGYFCFQTVWTDLYTWLEQRFEGPPRERYRLDAAPWSLRKLAIKTGKHIAWLGVALFTGVSFAAWFTDAYQLWGDYLSLQAPLVAWSTLLLFTLGTYLLAGFMREQVCLWLCPYGRIQGALIDPDTLTPHYDLQRGEPRGTLDRTGASAKGACIDCKQCVAVCPTGVDIREGLQMGCISCGLCIDACDSVMRRIDRPTGLIRYTSHNAIQGKRRRHTWARPQVLALHAFSLLAAVTVAWGLSHMSGATLSVNHIRQPLFVQLSDGSIQNRYEVRVFNKSDRSQRFRIELDAAEPVEVVGVDEPLAIDRYSRGAVSVLVRAAPRGGDMPLTFRVSSLGGPPDVLEYRSFLARPAE
ncbi:MAG: cytochrome c oxidase accessory protein CcoG [Candidatus Thiodiazotropha sp.]